MLLGIKFKISLIVFPLPPWYDKEQKIQKQKQNEDYQINTIIDYCIFKLSIWACRATKFLVRNKSNK